MNFLEHDFRRRSRSRDVPFHLLEHKREVKEIPRTQRYIGRVGLDKILSGQEGKAQRDIRINAAHLNHGYTLKEIADYLQIHYSTVSKVIGRAAINRK